MLRPNSNQHQSRQHKDDGITALYACREVGDNFLNDMTNDEIRYTISEFWGAREEEANSEMTAFWREEDEYDLSEHQRQRVLDIGPLKEYQDEVEYQANLASSMVPTLESVNLNEINIFKYKDNCRCCGLGGVHQHTLDVCPFRDLKTDFHFSSFKLKFFPAIIVALLIESSKRTGYLAEFPNLGERLEEDVTRQRNQYQAQRTSKVQAYMNTGTNPSGMVGNRYMPTGTHTNVPGSNGGYGVSGARPHAYNPHSNIQSR
jgi:hypothetical protein